MQTKDQFTQAARLFSLIQPKMDFRLETSLRYRDDTTYILELQSFFFWGKKKKNEKLPAFMLSDGTKLLERFLKKGEKTKSTTSKERKT